MNPASRTNQQKIRKVGAPPDDSEANFLGNDPTLGARQAPPATSKTTRSGNTMNEEMLEQLRAQVRASLVADKVTEDKRLKAEIVLLRSHAVVIEDKPGRFVCEGVYGQGVAEQKEATLFELATHKPLRWQPYKSHLFAVHSALCWAVLGISVG
jgi:hypothetical protein